MNVAHMESIVDENSWEAGFLLENIDDPAPGDEREEGGR